MKIARKDLFCKLRAYYHGEAFVVCGGDNGVRGHESNYLNRECEDELERHDH